ncbi:serine/threonine-protein kinase PAK 3-like [Paramacrobiotus metropolitanus]|uniref:serine/threonine-protein kinase PAK 3-like n=1 Tax=Paramacrobiotus metropolitanus TaxID=2943436 RepID=UPI002445CF7C|nr:serine/threonine-protein kinase PAK 3-like [Paramacrobiotus metropolitanus]XP_055357464.1 serine/threonine-protein kinase PAK 3-like [Paramacrobiotus metropolitanus]
MPQDEALQIFRQQLRTVLDTAAQHSPCHGGIFWDNVNLEKSPPPILGEPKDLKQLWTSWTDEGSAYVPYIPPEGVFALPDTEGETGKADAWALGCLAIQLINQQPLKLIRQWRFAQSTDVLQLEKSLLPKLKEFYTGAGQEKGLVIGPEMQLLRTVPCACKDFLSHCLELNPVKRWSLQKLSGHPFLDLGKSLKDLFAMDALHYQQTLPYKEPITVTNVRPHPFLKNDDPMLPHQIGEMKYKEGPDRPAQRVDILRFGASGEKPSDLQEHRDFYTKAYGKYMDALEMETSMDARIREWAEVYKIRALQEENKNIVKHFRCRFVAPQYPALPMEVQIITEHCPGGTFTSAAVYKLPIGIATKWAREVLQGLTYLHENRIVHRNINSSSIFFSEPDFKGHVKIGGFQYMRQLENDRTGKHDISARCGVDGRFVAPEIVSSYADDINIGRKCDIWSLGCVVLHLISGDPPLYTGAKNKPLVLEMAVSYHLNSGSRTLPHIDDWIPNNFRTFIRTCLDFNPDNRPIAETLLEIVQTGLFGITELEANNHFAHRKGLELPVDVVRYWESYA